MNMPLKGRVALVTGGASGIGAAAAERLARDGARVIIADMNPQGVEALAARLRDQGRDAAGVRYDQSSPEDIEALFTGAIAPFNRLDICFANAGWGATVPFLEMSLADWRKTYDINVTGTFLICQAAAKKMVAAGKGGSIIVTSSSGAALPSALFAGYCSAKAALNMLVKVMAQELGAFDIRINAIMPGVTATAMTGGLLKTRARDMVECDTPLGRLGHPDDIANAVAFLAGDQSSFITGTTLLVDGGGSLNAPQWFSTDNRVRGAADWKLTHKRLNLGDGKPSPSA